MPHFIAFVTFALLAVCNAFDLRTKILMTNDDGWAVAQIRDTYDAIKANPFYNVILSAPADNRSGTGSSTAPPTPLNTTCEFDTCPAGSPAEGFDPTDPRLNYVHSFPVDAVRSGIQTLSPKFFHSKPDIVLSGTNIGNNLGSVVMISGTVGAASEAALEGIPSVAFSGAPGAQVSFTTLSNKTLDSTKASDIYTKLVIKFTGILLIDSLIGPIMPRGVSVNVNFASITNCTSADKFKFVATRVFPDSNATDVKLCGTNHLTDETTAIATGCIATVSVFNATTKTDVSASLQKTVFDKMRPILSCL